MLKIMRKNTKGWIIKIILLSIVSVFVFWGVGNFKSETSQKVAVVNGEQISFREYSRLYHKLVHDYNKEINGLNQLNQNECDNFKRKALEQLIDRKLILQQANENNLRITNNELVDHIQSQQSFFKNSSFNISQYEYVVSNLGFTPREFEDYTRERLLIKKFIDMIYGLVSVSEFEIEDWYEWYYSPINLSYVIFEPSLYNSLIYSKEDLLEYFQQYKQNYRTQCKYKIRYLKFLQNDYLQDVHIGKSEIIEYYNLHKIDFSNEKKVNVSHILVKVDPGSGSGQTEKELIENISKMIDEGSGFSELATLYSDCPSKYEGGLIGDITYNSVVKPFAEKTFSMVSGEISSPVRTKFGWHIIRVNSIKEATKVPLNKSRKEIENILRKSKADMLAYNEAVDFLEKCYSKDDLVNNAELCDINLVETNWFNDKNVIGFSESDFSLIMPIISYMQVGEISNICKLNDGYFIMQVIGKKESEIPRPYEYSFPKSKRTTK